MFELSLSPAISTLPTPILAVTTAGTGGFAQALSDARDDGSARLAATLGGSLPPERQFPAATALLTLDAHLPDGAASPPPTDLATLIVVARPPHGPSADSVRIVVAEPLHDAGDHRVAPNHEARIPIIPARPSASVGSSLRVTAEPPAIPLVGLAVGRRIGKGADQLESSDRADSAEDAPHAVELASVSLALVIPAVPIGGDDAPTPPATASGLMTAATPTAPVAWPVSSPTTASATPIAGSAVTLPPETSPRASVAPPIGTDSPEPAIAAGAEQIVTLPPGIVVKPAATAPSAVPTDIVAITPGAPPAVVARPDAVVAVTPAPVPSPLIGVPVPALRAFAAAIAATNASSTRAAREDEATIPSLTVSAQPDPAIQQSDAPARPPSPIDMRREDWTRALIDRIDAVRDVANARDTRITLVPDALGKIEVALRREGETLHVAFAADAPATRALLADAQPRLAELAEARGLKLGDTAVSTRGDEQSDRTTNGFGQPADHRRPAPAPQGNAANRSNTTSPVHDRADSDNRIA